MKIEIYPTTDGGYCFSLNGVFYSQPNFTTRDAAYQGAKTKEQQIEDRKKGKR